MPITFIYLGRIGHLQSQSTTQPWRADPSTPNVFDKMRKEITSRTITICICWHTTNSACLGVSKLRKCPVVMVSRRRNISNYARPISAWGMINYAFHLTCRRFWINLAVARVHSRLCSAICIVSIHSIIDGSLSLYNQRLHTLTEHIFADLGQIHSRGHISRTQLWWKYPLEFDIRSDSGYLFTEKINLASFERC